MAITAYAFPVLYDLSFAGFARTPKTDLHGIFVIEFEDDYNPVRGFLFNRDGHLQGCTPYMLNPVDYDAYSWLMYNTNMPGSGLDYTEGSIRVRVKPLPLNSAIGKVIRHEYKDIPLKTIKDFELWE